MAVYVVAEGKQLGEDALREYLKARIAGFKVPEKLWLSDAPLPRLGTEKVDRRAVKARYAASWEGAAA